MCNGAAAVLCFPKTSRVMRPRFSKRFLKRHPRSSAGKVTPSKRRNGMLLKSGSGNLLALAMSSHGSTGRTGPGVANTAPCSKQMYSILSRDAFFATHRPHGLMVLTARGLRTDIARRMPTSVQKTSIQTPSIGSGRKNKNIFFETKISPVITIKWFHRRKIEIMKSYFSK